MEIVEVVAVVVVVEWWGGRSGGDGGRGRGDVKMGMMVSPKGSAWWSRSWTWRSTPFEGLRFKSS